VSHGAAFVPMLLRLKSSGRDPCVAPIPPAARAAPLHAVADISDGRDPRRGSPVAVRSIECDVLTALGRGPQLLERGLPALLDVARGDRRSQLAEALEAHVVVYPHRGPGGRRRQAVAHVPGEGFALLVLLEHARRLRAGHPCAHLLARAGAIEVVVARVGPGVAL
jgi:hypothetical protein